MTHIKTIENTLAGTENVLMDWRGYIEYCESDDCRMSPIRKFSDGTLMPDGRYINHQILRQTNRPLLQGHSAITNYLLNTGESGDGALRTLLNAGFIRMAYGEMRLPCFDFCVEPTAEQYAFIEMLDFEDGVQIDVKVPARNRQVLNKHMKRINGADVAEAIKSFYAKGCIGNVL